MLAASTLALHGSRSGGGGDDEIDERLAQRLLSESAFSEFAHIALVVLSGFLAWPSAPHALVGAWVGLVSAGALARGVLRRRAVSRGSNAVDVRSAIRFGVILLGIGWATGVLIVGTRMPLDTLGFVTVMLAGLISGATASLLADRVAYFTLLLLLLAPLAVSIGLHGPTSIAAVGVIVVALYGISMGVFYQRAHVAFVGQLRTARQLERSVGEAREARDAERNLARIIEATTDHIMIAGPDGTLRYINRAGRQMLGLSAEMSLTGHVLGDIVPARMHERLATEQLAAVRQNGVWAGESALLHRDGREIPVSVVMFAHRDTRGDVESISAIARDMTQEVAVRSALQTARDAAQQATAAKSAFLANTSHEIRTPLNGILGMVELLLDTELTAEQRRSAELIAGSGESLLETINDLLDLSKIEAGQLDLEEITFDLHHLVHSSVRLLMPRAHAKEIEMVSDVGSDVPQHVRGDPHRLRQVLSNLISNAVKFTNVGDVVVSAKLVSVSNARHRIHISVKDSGIGIAAADRERIFEPFKQADVSTTREYGGTGLGLSIARRVLELMGSTLSVESTPGVGSTFHFTVTLTASDDAPKTVWMTPAHLRGARVLVVDDHPVNRRVTSEMLVAAGCEVHEASGAKDALAELQRAAVNGPAYQVVASDVHMPGTDGFSLAESVRNDPAIRDIPIMLLTSAGQKGDAERCRRLGVAAYIQKPLSRVELIDATLAAIGTRNDEHTQSLVTRHSIEEARRSLHILLAEDNRVNQQVAVAMLRRRGHRVDVVDNGQKAIEAIEQHPGYDVILMDLQMPVLDGISATVEIRRRGHSELPIVALTANASDDERERCLAAGMNSFLAKPFKAHDLFAIIESFPAHA